MFVKGLFVICLQAVILKTVLSQCIGSPLIYDEFAPIAPVFSRIVGGNLVVDTSAPAPSGVSIFSDNILIEGMVLVTGNLPFTGTVGLEGIVPAVGTSAVQYECGTGNIGMSSEVPLVNAPPSGLGLGLAGGINRLSRL